MTAPLLDLANVHKAFGPVQALSGASLALFPGEIHALLGENGAGKSTLVSIAAGRLPLDSGEIHLAGAPLRLRSAREARVRGIALVPQHDLLVPAATVAENLALLDPHARFFESARFRRERVRRAEERFGLSLGDPDARVDGLPVGQRQRLEIAGALLDDPAVLILDEPTAVLSPDETDALFEA
ncbi:MAG: sugar ABC transporter ATP-binding protein, partial [Acidobacteria bacterium]|nr:sugar ABC transporter ATP-binding protein [Acidobacteriota bacterium]